MTESTARAAFFELQSSTSPCYTWAVPQKPVTVRIPFPVIDRLEHEAVESFRSLSSRGSEIGGILFGTVAPGEVAEVSIEDYELIACDYSRGPLYRLADADMSRFDRVIQQHTAAGSLSAVGIFRSHTRKGLSLDAEDLAFFDSRFREAHNIALLIRPFATKASAAGLFIREAGVVNGEATYLEFPFRSSLLSSQRPSGDTQESRPVSAAPAPSAPTPVAAPKGPVRGQIVPIASRRETPAASVAQPAEPVIVAKAVEPEPVIAARVAAPPVSEPVPVAAPPAPVVEQKVAKPQIEVKEAAPAVEEKVAKAPPPVEVAKPKVEAKSAPQPVEEKLAKLVEEKVAKAKVEDKVAKPPVEDRAAPPKVEEKIAKPVVEEKAAKAKSDDYFAKPVVEEKTAKPKADDYFAKPATEEKPTKAKDAKTASEEKTAKPAVEEKSAKPAVEQRLAKPTMEDYFGKTAPVEETAKPKVDDYFAKSKPVEEKVAPKSQPTPFAATASVSAATEEEPASGRGKMLWIGLGAGVLVLLLIVFLVYPPLLHRGRPSGAPAQDSSALSLRVERTAGEILLTWNRDSDPIRSATHAVLNITDGDQHENVEMDLAQLRNGSISYSPASGDVVFKMEVTGKNDEKTASESVRVLRTRPSPLAGAEPPPQPTAAQQQQAAKPATPVPGAPPTGAPAAANLPPVSTQQPQTQDEAPAKTPERALRPFQAPTLSARLHPANPADLPDAPTMNRVETSSPSSVAGLNMGSVSAPVAPKAAVPTPVAPPPAAEKKTTSGGQIQQAVLISRKDPEYPKLARETGAKGIVELLATIGADGRVKSVKVVKGPQMLQKAASDAVLQWKYKPTILNGVPVEAQTVVYVNFMGGDR